MDWPERKCCGMSPIMTTYRVNGKRLHDFYCPKCKIVSDAGETEEEAIKNWDEMLGGKHGRIK